MSGLSGDPSVFQDTFEQIVQENMDEFEMDREEAVEDALNQLKSQGVDTRILVSDCRAAGVPALVTELAQLASSADGCQPRLVELMQQLEQFCAAGLPHRCLAGRRGAYPPLVASLQRQPADALRTLAALQNGQPDLFRAEDASVLVQMLDSQPLGALAWAAAVTLKHEANRQALAEAGLLPVLAARLQQPAAAARALLPAVCLLLRQMTLDDDVRVQFGRAHQHACELVTKHAALDALMRLLTDVSGEPALAAEVLHTCTKLCVRTEFCEQVAAGGGVQALVSVMRDNPKSVPAVGRSFFFVRTLAGSDQVKDEIMKPQHGASEIIAYALDGLKGNPLVSDAAFAAIGALTLRSAGNADSLAAAGLVPIMVSALEQHLTSPRVQKLGCLAIRNMVSRSPQLCAGFRELGVESIINAALQMHGQEVDAEARSALRDLGCAVTLKEEWTGRGGALTTGLIKVSEQSDRVGQWDE